MVYSRYKKVNKDAIVLINGICVDLIFYTPEPWGFCGLFPSFPLGVYV